MSGQTSLHLIVGGIACALLPAQPQHSDPLGINPGPLPLYRPGVGFEAGLEAALSHLGTDYRRRAQFVESMLALASRGIPYSTVEAREAQLRPLRDTLAQVREAADVIGTPTRASATELARIKSTLDAAHQGGANASPES